MKTKFSFDEKCLDLARHFYPNEPEAMLHVLAQEFQDSAEDYIPNLRSDLRAIVDERRQAARAAVETSAAKCSALTHCICSPRRA